MITPPHARQRYATNILFPHANVDGVMEMLVTPPHARQRDATNILFPHANVDGVMEMLVICIDVCV